MRITFDPLPSGEILATAEDGTVAYADSYRSALEALLERLAELAVDGHWRSVSRDLAEEVPF